MSSDDIIAFKDKKKIRLHSIYEILLSLLAKKLQAKKIYKINFTQVKDIFSIISRGNYSISF